MLATVHVSSTDIEVTNGDGTWDTHLAKKLSRQSKRIEKPMNPFAPVYESRDSGSHPARGVQLGEPGRGQIARAIQGSY